MRYTYYIAGTIVGTARLMVRMLFRDICSIVMSFLRVRVDGKRQCENAMCGQRNFNIRKLSSAFRRFICGCNLSFKIAVRC